MAITPADSILEEFTLCETGLQAVLPRNLFAGSGDPFPERAKPVVCSIERLYLTTFSRHPAPAEIEIALKGLDSDRRRGAENLQWALINSPEFLFNY